MLGIRWAVGLHGLCPPRISDIHAAEHRVNRTKRVPHPCQLTKYSEYLAALQQHGLPYLKCLSRALSNSRPSTELHQIEPSYFFQPLASKDPKPRCIWVGVHSFVSKCSLRGCDGRSAARRTQLGGVFPYVHARSWPAQSHNYSRSNFYLEIYCSRDSLRASPCRNGRINSNIYAFA